MTLVAPRIVTDVSNVKRINHEIHFRWRAQCLVMFEDLRMTPVASRIVNDVSNVKRINHGIHFASFCVAGAVFGEVGG